MNGLLTVVASILVSHYTPVYCHAPAGGWQDNPRYETIGVTLYNPTRIYFRECKRAELLDLVATADLGHEILHAIHPKWSEAKVIRNERREGVLVRRMIVKYDE